MRVRLRVELLYQEVDLCLVLEEGRRDGGLDKSYREKVTSVVQAYSEISASSQSMTVLNGLERVRAIDTPTRF